MADNNVTSDARLARELQRQEMPSNAGGAAPSVQGGVVQGVAPGAVGSVPVVQGVQGGLGGGTPIVQGVAIGNPTGTCANAATATPVGYGMAATPYDMPYAVTVGGAAELTPQEITVLNYGFSLFCFTSIDVFATLFSALSTVYSLVSNGQGEREEDDERREARNVIKIEGIDAKYLGLLSFVFVIGPICGLMGARKLQRNLVTFYLIFCIGKTSFELLVAFLTPHLWYIVIAVLQLWITKIVYTFWKALGGIPPARCKELLDPNLSPSRSIRMVYW